MSKCPMSDCSICGHYHPKLNYGSYFGKKNALKQYAKMTKTKYGKFFDIDYDADETNISKPITKLDNVIFYNDDLDISPNAILTIDFKKLYPSVLLENVYIPKFPPSISIKMSDLHLYETAELYEYIKILASENKLNFWDLFKLEEIHNMSLIENIKDTPEPSDDIIYRITI